MFLLFLICVAPRKWLARVAGRVHPATCAPCGGARSPARTQSQAVPRWCRTMLRLSLFAILLTGCVEFRTAYVTDPPSFADRLDRLYEKLERFPVAAETTKLEDKLNAKLDRLNSLTPDRELTDADEELLTAIQMWGATDEQMQGVIQELQRIKESSEKSERLTEPDDADVDWNDEDDSDLMDGDYVNDVREEWDPLEEEMGSTSKPLLVTPWAMSRLDRPRIRVESAADAIAATNERPRILDDTEATQEERRGLRAAAVARMGALVLAGRCAAPQPRWLPVRKLAPAADTVYMPPCVQLHRCAPDSGCCHNEEHVCAPINGTYVALPFFLNHADGNTTIARMVFYNHTRCACVSRETLQATTRVAEPAERREEPRDKQADWRAPAVELKPERDEERTEPPQLRRCTCPRLFRSSVAAGGCACGCEWADAARRRDCQSLARGREHFGLRDRVCIEQGGCAPPGCEDGAYDRAAGRCPQRRAKRRLARRYHRRPDRPDRPA